MKSTFSSHNHIIHEIPDGSPQVILPDFEKIDVTKLKQDIPKFSPWTTSDSAKEWSTFLSTRLTEVTDAAASFSSERWPMELLHGFNKAQDCALPSILTEEEEYMVNQQPSLHYEVDIIASHKFVTFRWNMSNMSCIAYKVTNL